MAIAVDENTFVRPNVFKVFSRTAQGDANISSPKLNMSRFKKLIMWIRLSALAGNSTWTATLNHIRPESATEPIPAGDKIAHATTLARVNAGIARQQYGDVGATAALPEGIGDFNIDVAITGGGTATAELWIEGIP